MNALTCHGGLRRVRCAIDNSVKQHFAVETSHSKQQLLIYLPVVSGIVFRSLMSSKHFGKTSLDPFAVTAAIGSVTSIIVREKSNDCACLFFGGRKVNLQGTVTTHKTNNNFTIK